MSYADARETDAAARTVDRLYRYDPRSRATLTTLGEIHADRERYDRARAYWDRLPDIEPGNPAGYLEAATVFWDYYQFDDALRIIAQGRTKLRDPALYAYEAGAIYEGLRQPGRAIDEYVRGALAGGRRLSGAEPAADARETSGVSRAGPIGRRPPRPTGTRREPPPCRSGSPCSRRRAGVTISSVSSWRCSIGRPRSS